MRRIGALLLVALAVPVVGLALVIHAGPAAVARAGLAVADALAPCRASAQTTMQFHPVSGDSTSDLERERPSRRPEEAAPEPTSVPAPPVPPVPPVTRAGDLARFGNDIHVAAGEIVHGDVTAMGGDVTVDGTVQGDIAAIGGDVFLNATARVEGDVVSVGGTVHQDPGAYVSGRALTVMGAPGKIGRARGWHPRHGWGRWAEDTTEARVRHVAESFVALLFTIGLALLLVWLFPGRVASGIETVRRQPGISLGVGALVYALFVPSIVALAVVMVLLCITIIGIPLAIAALLGYVLFFVVFALFGLTIGNAIAGDWIARRRGTAGLALWQVTILGVLVIGGIRFLGRLLQVVPGFGALGGLLAGITMLVVIVLGTAGGGAWLKWEFAEGLFGRWRGRWENRRRPEAPPSPYGPPPGSPYGPAAAAPPPPPPPPAPPAPESYMPPTPEPPPSEPTPGT